MNELDDRLEAELSALRPHGASSELRQRIAEHQADVPRARLRWRWGLALVSGLAAACVPAAIFLHRGGSRIVEPEQPQVWAQPAPPYEVREFRPTLQAYQRALARSPEALEARLDKDAAVFREGNPELTRICAFTRSDAKLHALLGED